MHRDRRQKAFRGLGLQSLTMMMSSKSLLRSLAIARRVSMSGEYPSVSRCYTSSGLLFEKRRMKVPEMGESVREGTIVEWHAKIGEAVKTDDVVASVETDKVTIEIRAEVDGVLSQRFAEIDETVDVGGDLYELDTEGEAVAVMVAATETDPSSIGAAEDRVETVPASESLKTPTQSTRVPSIKFLGKDGWAKLLSAVEAGSANGASLVNINPMYGRPMFSEEEMEALIMGGASIAPEVVYHSSGAKFEI